jgi:hypothetical protein
MDSVTFHLLNLTCTAVFCTGLGLVGGYGWGKEDAFKAIRRRQAAREKARVNSFRTTFKAGISQKKEVSAQAKTTI